MDSDHKLMKFVNSKKRLFLIFLCVIIPQFTQSDEQIIDHTINTNINNGQDFTRPLTRLDLRFKYRKENNDTHSETFTLRTDKPISLKNGWILSTRFDLPYNWTEDETVDAYYYGYSVGLSNSSKKLHGLGDILLQGLFITPTYGKWTYALGLRVLFPSAKYEELGSGKYRLLPTVAVKYDLKDWVKGAWCALLVRQDFDVAGDKSRQSIQQTYVEPILNFDLPKGWFINFSPEMRYDWKSCHWFIPFDIMVGNVINKKWVLSLEYKNAIVNDFPQYKQEIEARIGYFF